jgi:hypothetical protein
LVGLVAGAHYAFCMFLAVLAVAAAPIAATPTPSALQAQIKQHFGPQLLDAASARWKWPAMRDGRVYCGWVNPKDRLGAYSGWTQYIVNLDNRGLVTDGVLMTPSNSAAFGLVCQMKGYAIDGPPVD